MKKRKKRDKYDWFLYIAFAVLILLLLVLMFFDREGINYNLSPLELFCMEKCVDMDVLYFKNVTEYNYTECECVQKIEHGDGKYASVASIDTISYYYDSQTWENLTKEEIEGRQGN